MSQDSGPTDSGGIDRRKALGIAAAAAGTAWVAPAIISAGAASAATVEPACLSCGSLLVNITGCFNTPGNILLTIIPVEGPPQFRDFPGTTPTPAGFLISNLCPGVATVTLTTGGQDICTSPQQIEVTCGGNPPLLTMPCPC